MHSALLPYTLTVYAMTATAVLLLVQTLVADVVAIRLRHTPGTPVPADHTNFLFRATRAYANTNETLGVFILLTILAIASTASPTLTNTFAWVYVAGRLGHMLFYYADLRIARSLAFGVSLIALFLLLVVVLLRLL